MWDLLPCCREWHVGWRPGHHAPAHVWVFANPRAPVLTNDCAVGAEALIYGAAAPWDTAGDRVGDGGRPALPPDQDLRVSCGNSPPACLL